MGDAARERVRANFLCLRELEDYLMLFRQAAGIDPRSD
jgi:hypothetical protein